MGPVLALPLAAVRTAATYLLVSIYVLLAGPPGLLLAMATGRVDHLYWLGIQGVRLGFALCGIRYVAEGTEHIRADRAAVYAMNHTSNLEPPVIYMVLRQLFPRFQVLYKAVLRKTPILGPIFDIAGFVPIDRRDRVQSGRAIAQAVRQIQEGYNFVVFPEGTRSRTGELLPFKKGAFIMAIQAQAPIVPVAIVGTSEAMRKGSPFIWPTTIQVKLGEPIPTEGLTIDDRDAVIGRVWHAMAALIGELRAKRAAVLGRREGAVSPADAEGQ
jgi:1-acyl-sn-glycerol-3-phosphate acyltransferase